MWAYRCESGLAGLRTKAKIYFGEGETGGERLGGQNMALLTVGQRLAMGRPRCWSVGGVVVHLVKS